MQILRHFSLLALVVLGMSSCSKDLSPFTKTLYQQNRWSENELSQIQFYLSDDIVIRRQIRDASSEIISGEIKMVDGREIEEVIIPKGTPGVLVDVKDNKRDFAISFERGRFLMFGPNPKMDGKYVLMASDWRDRRGKVNYDGKTFYTEPGNGFATLMVDLKKI
ncbi:MAG: hypothetical protein AAF598_06980, partial [Bacteroidota bacterium]